MKKFLLITLAFTILVPVGTLSHEYGHILVAKYLGHRTTLHYSSMNWSGEIRTKLQEIRKDYYEEIASDQEFPLKDKYESLSKSFKRDAMLIAIGGPIQTMITGLIGLSMLVMIKNRKHDQTLNAIRWIGIFLAFFWSRQIFNPLMSILKGVFKRDYIFSGGDEVNIANMLNLPRWSISISLGVIGVCICWTVIVKVVPQNWRKEFVLGGLLGSAIGFVLWMKMLGPILLP